MFNIVFNIINIPVAKGNPGQLLTVNMLHNKKYHVQDLNFK